VTFIPLDDFMIYYEDSERVRDHCLAFLKELKRMDTTCDICEEDKSPDFQLICNQCYREQDRNSRFAFLTLFISRVEQRVTDGHEYHSAIEDVYLEMEKEFNAPKN
jgi:hypothetical protein